MSPGPWCLSVRTRVVSVCLDACGVCLSLHACSVAMPAHRSGWGTRVRGSVTEPSAGEQQLPFLITAIIKALMMGRVLRPPAWHRGGWQELFAQLKPPEMSELGGGWWGQDELVATQGLSPHSLGVLSWDGEHQLCDSSSVQGWEKLPDPARAHLQQLAVVDVLTKRPFVSLTASNSPGGAGLPTCCRHVPVSQDSLRVVVADERGWGCGRRLTATHGCPVAPRGLLGAAGALLPPWGSLTVCWEAARHGTGTAASQLPDVSSLASPGRDKCWLRDLLRKLFIFRG